MTETREAAERRAASLVLAEASGRGNEAPAASAAPAARAQTNPDMPAPLVTIGQARYTHSTT